MELYTKNAYQLAELLTKNYSTSFFLSSRLFERSIRPHIYAIYGMVRMADEIVDTYLGKDSAELLNAFETEVIQELYKNAPFSTNPIIHAFAHTAKQFGIGKELIEPFFASMRMDLTKNSFTKDEYDAYIYGSAEVIGLMCLRIFVSGNDQDYGQFKSGAQKLGSAYQKVNFLRDIAADFSERGRYYFPVGTFDLFDDTIKQQIISDIEADFAEASKSVERLPRSAKKAVRMSVTYYKRLLSILNKTSSSELKKRRFRVPTAQKAGLLAKGILGL
jgi:phytoene/squalene synthetase